jgi:glutaconate CoA-transferase subunit A
MPPGSPTDPFNCRGHEIIARAQGSVLARATPDLLYDQMVAARARSDFFHMGNQVGSLRIVRGAMKPASWEWEEYSHFGMISRLQAVQPGCPSCR